MLPFDSVGAAGLMVSDRLGVLVCRTQHRQLPQPANCMLFQVVKVMYPAFFDILATGLCSNSDIVLFDWVPTLFKTHAAMQEIMTGQGKKWIHVSLGPPVVPFLTPFLGENSPTEIDYRKKLVPLF